MLRVEDERERGEGKESVSEEGRLELVSKGKGSHMLNEEGRQPRGQQGHEEWFWSSGTTGPQLGVRAEGQRSW